MSFWRILRHAGPTRIILVAIAVLAIAVVVNPSLVAKQDPSGIDASAILEGPSWAHLFGTDELGADIFARVVYALRLEAAIAVGSVAIAGVVGIPLGLVGGYFGRRIDGVFTVVADSILAFPIILFAVLIVAAFGPSVVTIIGVLSFVFFPRVYRLVRGQTEVLKARTFVSSAKAIGLRSPRIMFRHILPNTIGPLSVLIPQLMAVAILVEAGLSFLGLGIQPPQVSWGTLLFTSKSYYTVAPWYAISAGAVVTGAAMYLMVAGDMTSESSNPLRRS